MRKQKEILPENGETIFELEQRIKRTAKNSLPLLHEIEKQRIKDGWRYMSADNGKTSVLVNPKNFEKKISNGYVFIK